MKNELRIRLESVAKRVFVAGALTAGLLGMVEPVYSQTNAPEPISEVLGVLSGDQPILTTDGKVILETIGQEKYFFGTQEFSASPEIAKQVRAMVGQSAELFGSSRNPTAIIVPPFAEFKNDSQEKIKLAAAACVFSDSDSVPKSFYDLSLIKKYYNHQFGAEVVETIGNLPAVRLSKKFADYKTTDGTATRLGEFGADCITELKKKNTSFTDVLLYAPADSTMGAAWGGEVQGNGFALLPNLTWVSENISVVTHEFGHMRRLRHAAGPLGQAYENYSTVMGYPYVKLNAPQGLSVYERYMLGYLTPTWMPTNTILSKALSQTEALFVAQPGNKILAIEYKDGKDEYNKILGSGYVMNLVDPQRQNPQWAVSRTSSGAWKDMVLLEGVPVRVNDTTITLSEGSVKVANGMPKLDKRTFFPLVVK